MLANGGMRREWMEGWGVATAPAEGRSPEKRAEAEEEEKESENDWARGS